MRLLRQPHRIAVRNARRGPEDCKRVEDVIPGNELPWIQFECGLDRTLAENTGQEHIATVEPCAVPFRVLHRHAAVQRGKAEFGVDLVESGTERRVGTDGGVQFSNPRHDQERLFAHAASIVSFVYVARVAIVTDAQYRPYR